MFFSPSCRYCVEGIDNLSGNVYMAFYPVEDSDTDIYRIARMKELLDKGLNISEALRQSADFTVPGYFSFLRPDLLLLRFRLLINKAHVYSAGSQGVPFFEYLGLPPEIKKKIQNNSDHNKNPGSDNLSLNKDAESGLRDPDLPIEIGGQCGGVVPCPPAN